MWDEGFGSYCVEDCWGCEILRVLMEKGIVRFEMLGVGFVNFFGVVVDLMWVGCVVEVWLVVSGLIGVVDVWGCFLGIIY